MEPSEETLDNFDKWEVYQYALGNENGEAEINVAAVSDSSSLLPMLPQHEISAPHSKYIGKEKILIKKLEDLAVDLLKGSSTPYLKVDTQGYERQVVEGCGGYFGRFSGIQLEMSLVPLYEGGWSMIEVMNYLEQEGFMLYSIEPGFNDKVTGQLLQVDGIFVNKKRGKLFPETAKIG